METTTINARDRKRALARIERAAEKRARAVDELEEALNAAAAAGLPLRPLAEAAGLSVEGTRKLLMRTAAA